MRLVKEVGNEGFFVKTDVANEGCQIAYREGLQELR